MMLFLRDSRGWTPLAKYLIINTVLIHGRNWIADTDSSTPNMGENIDTTQKKTQKLY
jgi:hypothetical protein